MTVYIVDGKPYGLSAHQIALILDQGISTFDQLVESFSDGSLDDVFVATEQFIEVGQALLEYTNRHVGPNDSPRFLHLIADAKEYGFTDQMIELLHSRDIYTIVQAMDGLTDRVILDLFPEITDRTMAIRAINTSSLALTRQLIAAQREQKPAESLAHANLGYRHCQYGPSLN